MMILEKKTNTICNYFKAISMGFKKLLTSCLKIPRRLQ